MKWNGMVSQRENQTMDARLTREKATQARSTQAPGNGHDGACRHPHLSPEACELRMNGSPSRSGCRSPVVSARRSAAPGSGGELIALTAHRLDEAEPELGAEPPDAHVHHVGAGV